VVLDLLTNPRYGAGQRTFTTNAPLNQQVFQPGVRFDDVDKASFYKAQKYCEDHDITFDATVAGDADTIELLRSVTSTFQGQLIYQGGYVSVVIDDQVKDTEQHFLFTDANVIQSSDGGEAEPGFIYEGTGKRARTTAIQVSYIDKTNFYKEAKVLVEDRDAMQKYGYNLNKIRALGCTDREQAKRMGRYTLATNLRSTETVTFKVGPEGALLLPGDVCLIGDPLKTRIEAGGRIASASSSAITVDRDLTSGINYTDGGWYLYTYTTGGLAQRSRVQSITGRTINVTGLSQAPSSNMLWILVDEGSTNNTVNRFNRYKIQKITENNDGTYSIIGIKYDHAKYDFVNKGEADYSNRKTLNTKVNKALDGNKITFRVRTTNPMP
jgi:predicted phage tail protein